MAGTARFDWDALNARYEEDERVFLATGTSASTHFARTGLVKTLPEWYCAGRRSGNSRVPMSGVRRPVREAGPQRAGAPDVGVGPATVSLGSRASTPVVFAGHLLRITLPGRVKVPLFGSREAACAS